MGVMGIVVAGMHHAYVGLSHLGFLAKLMVQELFGEFKIAVKQPAHHSQGKHVATLEDALVVHTRVFQTVFHHRGDGASHHAVGVYAQFAQIVVGEEIGLAQVVGTEAVGVDDDGGLGSRILVLGLQRSGIHRHQHVTTVTGSIYRAVADVHLESGNTRKRALRGTDVGRIIGEGTDVVAHGGRNGRKDVAGQLHAVTGVARESYYNLIQLFDYDVFFHNRMSR